MEFNEKLQELRKSRSLTQEELAEAMPPSIITSVSISEFSLQVLELLSNVAAYTCMPVCDRNQAIMMAKKVAVSITIIRFVDVCFI